MNALRCLIVEDEPLAAEILSEYIGMTPTLNHIGTCSDALEALEVLDKEKVDVLFLDINLPKINGIEFIKTLRKQPKVIVTSAHHEYAVEGFDLRVVDYLLKPIEFSRFTKAVNKLSTANGNTSSTLVKNTGGRPYYFFTVSKRSVKIYLDEILFIESLKDSVSIHTPSKSYQTHYQLGELEELMRSDNFLRIHRSFMIAVDKIDSFSASEVEISGRKLPIGRSHKQYVMEKLGR